ncbi:hypothetical protein Tco_1123118 [Tanacetum coccineum]|uniref:Uncharacterized protein n=1 Tax=Tanacetum coccineum TaxID=301880 RepID=A0ABQ5J508_9ASTR
MVASEDNIADILSLPLKRESLNYLRQELSKVSDYDNFVLAPQLQKTSDHNSSKLKTYDHSNEPSSSKLVPNGSPLANTTAPLLQELNILFNPLYDEFFTAGNSSVPKSSSPSDSSLRQDTHPTVNAQSTTAPITITTNVNADENNTDIQAEIQAEDA